jgi:hypothetical protein
MKKYILTEKGKKLAYKLKISQLYLEANFSNATLYKARQTGIFSHKLLIYFFEKYLPNFTQGVHYIKYNPNAIRCATCGNEMHDTQPHNCNENNH